MTFSKIQLEAGIKVLKEFQEKAETIVDFHIDYLKFLYHPETPHERYIKIRTNGISGGELFDNIDYISINEKGEIGNPALLFNCMKERITFYADFKQIDIAGNRIKSKK